MNLLSGTSGHKLIFGLGKLSYLSRNRAQVWKFNKNLNIWSKICLGFREPGGTPTARFKISKFPRSNSLYPPPSPLPPFFRPSTEDLLKGVKLLTATLKGLRYYLHNTWMVHWLIWHSFTWKGNCCSILLKIGKQHLLGRLEIGNILFFGILVTWLVLSIYCQRTKSGWHEECEIKLNKSFWLSIFHSNDSQELALYACSTITGNT